MNYNLMLCEVCQKPMAQAPMVFRGERYCSDNCRKVLLGNDPTPYLIRNKNEGRD